MRTGITNAARERYLSKNFIGGFYFLIVALKKYYFMGFVPDKPGRSLFFHYFYAVLQNKSFVVQISPINYTNELAAWRYDRAPAIVI